MEITLSRRKQLDILVMKPSRQKNQSVWFVSQNDQQTIGEERANLFHAYFTLLRIFVK